MSGIVAIVNLDGAPVDRGLLDRMTASMAVRGPDAQHEWTDGSVGFGHAMLRTTYESEEERQPWTIDGDVWITADARVDARADLLRKLAAQGRAGLDERPDVELILHAYQSWGEACVDHLIGDFVFAIWDAPRRRLFCARDQMGVKPFYYARVGASLVLSNSLNCIRLHPAVSGRLNDVAIADFLVMNGNQDPAATSFADIQRLEPGCVLTSADGDVRTRRYWSFPIDDPIRYRRTEEYVEHFQEIFGAAIADRLRTHRASILMSGGLDSSSVAAAVKHHRLAGVRACDLHAQTLVYDRLIPDQERQYATIVAASLGMPIHVRAVDDYALYANWNNASDCTPEPWNDPLSAFGRDLNRDASAHGRVALTGFGGDPLFRYQTDVIAFVKAGTPWRIVTDVAESLFVNRRLPPVSVRTTLRRLVQKQPAPAPLPRWLDRGLTERLGLDDRYRERKPAPVKALHPVRGEAQRLLLDAGWPALFEFRDPGVVGVPLETRHPYFDLRVMRYVLAIPPLPWSQDKELLRTQTLAVLPEVIRRRPKAPLAGDPVGAKWRDEATRNRIVSLASTLRSEYVDGAVLRQVLSSSATAPDLWTNLRPLSLDYWLRWAKPTSSA